MNTLWNIVYWITDIDWVYSYLVVSFCLYISWSWVNASIKECGFVQEDDRRIDIVSLAVRPKSRFFPSVNWNSSKSNKYL